MQDADFEGDIEKIRSLLLEATNGLHLNLQVRRATLWRLARNKKIEKICITTGRVECRLLRLKRKALKSGDRDEASGGK
jgi:hypothetical protein